MPSNKIKIKPKAEAKRAPVKAGSSMPKNIGGFINAKIAATVRKRKKKR